MQSLFWPHLISGRCPYHLGQLFVAVNSHKWVTWLRKKCRRKHLMSTVKGGICCSANDERGVTGLRSSRLRCAPEVGKDAALQLLTAAPTLKRSVLAGLGGKVWTARRHAVSRQLDAVLSTDKSSLVCRRLRRTIQPSSATTARTGSFGWPSTETTWDRKWLPGEKHWQCSATGMVTMGLASHWPCVIDRDIPTYGLTGLRQRNENATYTSVGMSAFTCFYKTAHHALWSRLIARRLSYLL